MAEVDRLFQVCAIGGFTCGIYKQDVFDSLIEKINNFEVKAIEDELTADARELKNNLQTARLILRNAPKSLNENKLFPEYSELDSIYEKIKRIDGEEWASRVVGGLAGVASHANGLIADVSKIIDELIKYNDERKDADMKRSIYKTDEDETANSASATGVVARKPKAKKNFADIIQYPNKDELLRRLHFLIDGKGGKDVGLVLCRAISLNYLTRKPTQSEYESEFRLIGTWLAIYKYMGDTDANLEKSNKIVIFEQE